jgi:hypothetical protein
MLSALLPAAAQDSLIVAQLRSNLHRFSLQQGELDGEGANIIKEGIGESQFTLIGEMHGIREVGEFTAAVFREANTHHNYRYLAVETDPFIAERLEEIAGLENGDSELEKWVHAYPFLIPFYNNSNDLSMFRTVTESGLQAEPNIWGLDQAFMTAPRYYFDRLAENAPNEEARSVAESYSAKAYAAFTEAFSNQRPDKALLLNLKPEDYRTLENAFRGSGDRNMQMIAGLEKSQEIYSKWMNGEYYQNNRIRSRLMKEHFMTYYQQARETHFDDYPKVVFKFGQNHTYRGLTPVGIYDLGNTLSELAEMNGSQSLHISFLGLGGEYLDMNPTREPVAQANSYNGMEDLEPLIAQAVEPYLDRPDWLVIDFRPLREKRMKGIPDKLKHLINAFDLYVLVPETKASESLEK